MELLSAQSLSLAVEGRTLFAGLDVRLYAGEKVALTGPTGSGKSQLCRVLGRFRKADEGGLFLQGKRSRNFAPQKWRSWGMYWPQAAQLHSATVLESLRRPFAWKIYRERQWSRHSAAGLLLRLGVNEAFLDKRVADLSGGERQLTALVRALLLDPQILLADEATSALDAGAWQLVRNLLDDWVGQGDRALLYTSHSAEHQSLAQRSINLGASNG